MDYALLPSPGSHGGFETDTVLLTCLDTLFVLSLNRARKRWEAIRRIHRVSGIDVRLQKSVKLVVSPLGGMIQIFVNNMEAAVLNSRLKILGEDIWKQKMREPEEGQDGEGEEAAGEDGE